MLYSNKKVLFGLFLFTLMFISCLLDTVPVNYRRYGVSISGYEDWMMPKSEDLASKGLNPKLYFDNLYGYSDWMDWNSEEGDKLRYYIDIKLIPNDFSGKFRILVYGQKFFVGFNDENFTTVAFYNYCGIVDEVLQDKNGLTFRGKALTKLNDNVYIYTANFIKRPHRGVHLYYLEKQKRDDNTVVVLIERIPESNSDFRYSIKIRSKDIFNGILHCLAPYPIYVADLPKWFPKSFREITGFTAEHTSSFYYGDMSFDFAENKIVTENEKSATYLFEFKNDGLPILFSADGIENPTFDNENQIFKFYLKGRKDYEAVDYVVCKVLNEAPLGQSRGFTRKGTLTFYKENPNGDDIVVKHFDENHTEFTVGEKL